MKVTGLTIYPVKSMRGIDLESSDLLATGLRFDRQWMLVQPDGRFMTQREFPQMALVETAIEGDELVVSSFGMDELRIAPADPDRQARMETEIWGDGVSALVYDEDTNAWFSDAVGTPCRLVGFPLAERRQCDPDYALEGDHTFFADGYPVLLISEASLADLNSRLEQPVGMNRFRPNIVVDGCDPFAEDGWKNIEINGLGLRFTKLCPRCSVPTVDPERGMLAGPEPIHTLSGYRTVGGEVMFGVNLVPENEGVISVGDRVRILN